MQIRKLPRRKRALVIIIVIITLVFINRARAQSGIDTSLANALQRSLDSMRIQYNVKGISAAAFIPGVGTWKGVTGESYAGVPIDTTMLFDIGSTTKTFVATEIFKLIESGALSLSDTLGALLPPISSYIDPRITVQQLLGHTSGLGDYTNASWSAAMNADLTKMWYFPTSLAAFLSPPIGFPGSPFAYRNANYSLLGMIIEAKKGDSLHRVLRNDLLTPYGLGNTYMELFEPYPNAIPHNWATPTLNPALATDESAIPHEALWSSTEGAGGFFADPGDLVKWGYKLYSGKILSPASLSQMLTFTPVSSSYFNGYGLGCQRFVANGRTYYGHAGNFFGYATSMLYYPQDSICVAVLINQDCIATFEARTLMHVLLNKIATGVKEQVLADKVVVSPNPANTELTISIPVSINNAQVTVNDATGRQVYAKRTNAKECSINTESFTPGTYFIKVAGGDQEVTKQVIIQH